MRHQTRIITSLAVAMAAVLALSGCYEPGESPATESQAVPAAAAPAPAATGGGAEAVPERVLKAAAIARAIRTEPGSAEAILQREGMTREEFEELLYEIAADPALSAAYETELEK